jgi:hypothetical protein
MSRELRSRDEIESHLHPKWQYSLKSKKIIEDILLSDFEHDLIYDKANILNNIAKNDRLIEPSFDDPEKNLAFNPEFYLYESKKKMG